MNNIILTSEGKRLLAMAMNGRVLQFSKGMTGDGVLGNRNPESLTQLISPKQDLPIRQITTSKTGTCELILEQTNKDLTEGYPVREYGVFARDPDTHKDTLYAYANRGEKYYYLEKPSGNHYIFFVLSLVVSIENAAQVTAIINLHNNYVTYSRLDARIADLYAEGATPLGFWTFTENDKRFRPIDISQARKILLGDFENRLLALEHKE